MASTHRKCCCDEGPCWALMVPCRCNSAIDLPDIAVRCVLFPPGEPQRDDVFLMRVVIEIPDITALAGVIRNEFEACYRVLLEASEIVPPGFTEVHSDTTVGDEYADCDGCCGPDLRACCFPDGSCEDLTPEDCRAAGGIPSDADVPCVEIVCPPPGCPICETCNHTMRIIVSGARVLDTNTGTLFCAFAQIRDLGFFGFDDFPTPRCRWDIECIENACSPGWDSTYDTNCRFDQFGDPPGDYWYGGLKVTDRRFECDRFLQAFSLLYRAPAFDNQCEPGTQIALPFYSFNARLSNFELVSEGICTLMVL